MTYFESRMMRIVEGFTGVQLNIHGFDVGMRRKRCVNASNVTQSWTFLERNFDGGVSSFAAAFVRTTVCLCSVFWFANENYLVFECWISAHDYITGSRIVQNHAHLTERISRNV